MPSTYKSEKPAQAARDDSSGSRQSAREPREVYRSQQNLYGKNNVWNTHTEDFTPRHTKYAPKSGRIMLYGYLAEGVVDWDDIVVKQILPPSAGLVKGEKRHSQASKVTLKEMEEDDRRGQRVSRRTSPGSQDPIEDPARRGSARSSPVTSVRRSRCTCRRASRGQRR